MNKNTTYLSLVESFFSKIKDYDFITMLEEDVQDIVIDYIPAACLMFESCDQDLDDRNDVIGEFNYTLSPVNFEILSNFMVIVYLDSTYIRTSLMLQAHMSTTDFHKYDNNNVLGKVIEVRDMYKKENKQLMINHSLRGDSDFKKIYQKNGSYNVSKLRNKRHCFTK